MKALLSVLLLLSPLAVAAETYRWVDAQGHVHFTQTRPPKGTYEILNPSAPPAGSGPSQSSLGAYAREVEHSNATLEENRAREREKAERRAKSCKQAQAQLKLRGDYEGRTFSTNENGEREPWSQEQYARERERLQKQIAENCGE